VSAEPARKRPRRAIDGVLLLDKPEGITSQRAVTRVRVLFHAAKAGHTGTLDPMATGLLPIALGEATKFTHVVLESDKAYRATIRLGVTTTTGDIEGSVLARSDVRIARADIDAVLSRFRGDILQTPPMFSAIKHAGKPLYEYARSGADVPRAPRGVTIRALEVQSFEGTDLCVDVVCSKGTYIRVLAEDIGHALGCGATLAALRRTRAGEFCVADAVTLASLEGMTEAERLARLLPVDALLATLPAVELDSEQADRIVLGQPVACSEQESVGSVRLYRAGVCFLGLAEACEGRLQPRRLLAAHGAKA
jgi:tRNA pseudouridine55 synthase